MPRLLRQITPSHEAQPEAALPSLCRSAGCGRETNVLTCCAQEHRRALRKDSSSGFAVLV